MFSPAILHEIFYSYYQGSLLVVESNYESVWITTPWPTYNEKSLATSALIFLETRKWKFDQSMMRRYPNLVHFLKSMGYSYNRLAWNMTREVYVV